MQPERIWVFALLIEDAPGSLMDVLSAFSYRGVSIESVLGLGRPICSLGVAILAIRCSEKRARELERITRRLPVVSDVHRFPAASGRTVVVEVLRPGARIAAEGLTTAKLAEGWSILSGPEPAVRRYLRAAIDRGEVGRHVEILLE